MQKISTPFLHPLTVALSITLFPSIVFAQQAHELDAITVMASPLGGDAEAQSIPVEVLYGQELDKFKSSTLGDTVSKLPGVQTTNFGPGVGRPIIRGQEGPRVQVLSSGITSLDASTVSADHAVGVEPFLADQIEVLKGPSTLLFGSGAIGGAVNVVDGRIANALPEAPLSGRAEIRGNTVNEERTGMFRLDGVNGNWVVHLDGLVRNTDDFDIPGHAIVPSAHDGSDHHDDHNGHDHEHEHEEDTGPYGRLNNSAIKTRAGAVGATWLGESAYFGLAASTYRTNYGIPDGAHVHAEDGHGHDHGHDHDDDHGHGHDHDEDHDDHGHGHGDGDDHDHDHDHAHESVRVELVQNRVDLKTGLYEPTSFLKSINLRGAYTDYEHVELEGNIVGTRFANEGFEARLEAVQQELAGWNGAFGLQVGSSDFSAVGLEAFVPSTSTDSAGLFIVQRRDFGPVALELGARHEQVRLKADNQPKKDFNATSLSIAGAWRLSQTFDLRFGLDSAERAPTNEELFAGGAHIATRSIEIGDAHLDTEKSRRGEIGLHAHTKHTEIKLAVFETRFKDFIYLSDTGISERDMPVRLWNQQDATFRGAEAEAKVHLIESAAVGDWDVRVFGDYVRAKLDGSGARTVDFEVPHGDHSHAYSAQIAQSGDLPRIAPMRIGADVSWAFGGLNASVGAVRYSKQDDVALNEATSDGYTLVDAHLAYRWDVTGGAWELFLDGSNLTNREARPHTSLLRDYAPLPGRAVGFGVRAFF